MLPQKMRNLRSSICWKCTEIVNLTITVLFLYHFKYFTIPSGGSFWFLGGGGGVPTPLPTGLLLCVCVCMCVCVCVCVCVFPTKYFKLIQCNLASKYFNFIDIFVSQTL